MTRHITAAALLLALAACGGSNAGNAAIGKTFSYGAPSALPSTQASTLQAALQAALAIGTAADPSAAEGLSDPGSMTSTLLGDTASLGFMVAPSTPERAALMLGADAGGQRLSSFTDGAAFSNPGCITTTATSLTLAGCSLTVTDATNQTKITADGTASLAGGTLTWDFTVGVTMTGSGFSASARAHRDGHFTVTASTLEGQVLTEVSGSASGGGRSESLAVSESVVLDLSYVTAPACITSGTLEAKRVWTDRPSDTSGADYGDRGALVTWTGCGIATIALSR
jgi:hypothetical protein